MISGILRRTDRVWPVAIPAGVAFVGLTLLLFRAVVIHTAREVSPLNITDFLISYRGGFVRRGLLGELLYRVPFLTSLHRVELALKASSVAAYCAAFSLLAATIHRATRSAAVTLLVALQPFLFGFPVLNGQWMKKDLLLILVFYISLRVLRSPTISAGRLILLNLLSIAAILTHELYGIAILPIVIAIAASQPSAERRIPAALARSVFVFSPSLAALLVAGAHRGNSAIAAAILAAWRAKGVALVDWTQAIDALGEGSVWRMGLDELLEYARHGSWQRLFVTLLFWTAIAIVSASTLSLAAGLIAGAETDSRSRRRRVIDAGLVAAMTAVFFSPLFIMALDYGRWVFVWLSVTGAIVFSPAARQLVTLAEQLTPGLAAPARRAIEACDRILGPASPLRFTPATTAAALTASLFFLPVPAFMMEGCCSLGGVLRFSLGFRLGQIVLAAFH